MWLFGPAHLLKLDASTNKSTVVDHFLLSVLFRSGIWMSKHHVHLPEGILTAVYFEKFMRYRCSSARNIVRVFFIYFVTRSFWFRLHEIISRWRPRAPVIFFARPLFSSQNPVFQYTLPEWHPERIIFIACRCGRSVFHILENNGRWVQSFELLDQWSNTASVPFVHRSTVTASSTCLLTRAFWTLYLLGTSAFWISELYWKGYQRIVGRVVFYFWQSAQNVIESPIGIIVL